jgi:hypothetical protein
MNRNYSDWKFICPTSHDTIVHWLAYWNDYESIDYLISIICDNDDLMHLFAFNKKNLTPLDIAGQHF